MVDPDLADAYFLDAHPGWSWDDLQRAPADVVETMRMIEHARIDAHNRAVQG